MPVDMAHVTSSKHRLPGRARAEHSAASAACTGCCAASPQGSGQAPPEWCRCAWTCLKLEEGLRPGYHSGFVRMPVCRTHVTASWHASPGLATQQQTVDEAAEELVLCTELAFEAASEQGTGQPKSPLQCKDIWNSAKDEALLSPGYHSGRSWMPVLMAHCTALWQASPSVAVWQSWWSQGTAQLALPMRWRATWTSAKLEFSSSPGYRQGFWRMSPFIAASTPA
mmetsp:Transcript_12330/g.38606  ORF Transcript_12330/g.38606 Transcript_12330/m.38606 type:complete len:225 (-) Transcript_12330:64-738(-)